MSTGQPNILLLLSDEHSFRFLDDSDANHPRETLATPTLDRLRRAGTMFENTYCAVPVCTPSRLCLLTGREAQHCGAWKNSSMLRGEETTIAGAFSAAGYVSSLAGKMHLGGDRQFAGFDRRPYGDLTGYHGHQGEPLPDRAAGLADDPSRIRDAGVTEIPESILQENRVVHETVSFIREREARDGRPWLACASFARPHFPLTAPRRFISRYWDLERDEPTERFSPPPLGKSEALDHPVVRADRNDRFGYDRFEPKELLRARACYFACVEFIDEIIGDLIGTLERGGHLENTIVVYTSDHGELAGEHGLWWKSVWHEGSTRVPLIVQTPDQHDGVQPPNRVRTPVSLIDLFPTLCGLANIESGATLDGVDLPPAIREEAEPEPRPIYTDNLNPMWGDGTEYRMIRDGVYKYVEFRDPDIPDLLFNLEEDPFETENLLPTVRGETNDLAGRFAELVSTELDFDRVERQRLRDRRTTREHQLDVSKSFRPDRGGLNAYHLPNGHIVETEETLYRPSVITAEPENVFADFPCQTGK